MLESLLSFNLVYHLEKIHNHVANRVIVEAEGYVAGQRKIIQWLRSRSIRNHSGSLRTPILWFFELESDEKDEYFESRYGKV